MRFHSVLIVLLILSVGVSSKFTQAQIERYIEDTRCDETSTVLIATGKLKGLFSMEEIWNLHGILRQEYPNVVSEPFKIGETTQGKPIEGFFIGADTGDDEHKNILLIDSLHHAREFITQSMIVQIMVDSVKQVVKCSDEFYLNNRLVIIPVVNVDSVAEISKHFQDSTWPMKQKIRKNMRLNADCHGIENGVDLNRNYDFEFEKIKEGPPRHPCSEEYIGPKPFSEPETRAIRDLIDQNPNIVSALNFHSYANAWVRPYSYTHNTNEDALKKRDYRLWKLYKDFEKAARPSASRIRFGTAMELVKYVATGEASDWMLSKRSIFAWSPELGCDKSGCDTFYPREEAQTLTIQYVSCVTQEPLPDIQELPGLPQASVCVQEQQSDQEQEVRCVGGQDRDEADNGAVLPECGPPTQRADPCGAVTRPRARQDQAARLQTEETRRVEVRQSLES